MFVVFVFAAARFAAVARAGGPTAVPGGRTWWLVVAAVAGGIAGVKAAAPSMRMR